jgi:hypothetical protein
MNCNGKAAPPPTLSTASLCWTTSPSQDLRFWKSHYKWGFVSKKKETPTPLLFLYPSTSPLFSGGR